MPFVLLALFGIGAWVATRRAGSGTSSSASTFLTKTTEGLTMVTPDGFTLGIEGLERYAPAMGATSTANETGFDAATTTKTFLGYIGSGSPPFTIQETAIAWVQLQFMAGKIVLVPRALIAAHESSNVIKALPQTVRLLATDNAVPATTATRLRAMAGPGGSYAVLNPDPSKTVTSAWTWNSDLKSFNPTLPV